MLFKGFVHFPLVLFTIRGRASPSKLSLPLYRQPLFLPQVSVEGRQTTCVYRWLPLCPWAC